MELIYSTFKKGGPISTEAELGDLLLIESAERYKGARVGNYYYLGVFHPSSAPAVPPYDRVNQYKIAKDKKKISANIITILNPFRLLPYEVLGRKRLYPLLPLPEQFKIFEKVSFIDNITVGQDEIINRVSALPNYAGHTMWISQLEKPYLPSNFLKRNKRLSSASLKEALVNKKTY